MRILIEEHKYEAQEVKDILHGIDALESVEGFVSLNYVGYFYNTQLKDCVFILPKVLIEDKNGQELVFGKYPPKDIINLDVKNPLSETEKKFIYEFAVWIYRAIVVFKQNNQDSGIVFHKKIIQAGKGIEINTAGLKYGLPFAHPKQEILARFLELGGKYFTVGSDAHKPEHMAFDFEKEAALLENIDTSKYAIFKQRNPVFVSC